MMELLLIVWECEHDELKHLLIIIIIRIKTKLTDSSVLTKTRNFTISWRTIPSVMLKLIFTLTKSSFNAFSNSRCQARMFHTKVRLLRSKIWEDFTHNLCTESWRRSAYTLSKERKKWWEKYFNTGCNNSLHNQEETYNMLSMFDFASNPPQRTMKGMINENIIAIDRVINDSLMFLPLQSYAD